MVCLVVGTAVLGYFMITLDPFLNLWDERIHALVAKNLGSHFLKPTLYENPLFNYNYQNWAHNHVWVHKQPLFLWQMALSIKIFGSNIIGVRMPSVILHAIIPYFIYRIGKISSNDSIGFYGALFFAVAMFPLELCSGYYSTDHNDLSFLFYVTASFWAWFEFHESPKKRWIILIGLFAGCAILVKWLVGLLVYAIWGITSLIDLKKAKWNFIVLLPMVYALLITVVVALPWQLYTRWAFPIETVYEMQFNTKHFFEPVEGHEGPWWYHFDKLYDIYGSGYIIPVILLAAILSLVYITKKLKHRIAIALSIIVVYTFYSLAATKMISFGIIVSPFIYLGFAALIYLLIKPIYLIRHKILRALTLNFLILVPTYFVFDLNAISTHHGNSLPGIKWNRDMSIKEMQLIEKLKPEKKAVLFNATTFINSHIPVMFYTNYIAYDFVPTKEQINTVRALGYKTYIVGNGNLPAEICDEKMILLNP